MTHPPERVDCCISGCGPAGAVLSLLLARAGLDVLVLEKHADFLRDFRGDTIHPSTLELMAQLGLAEQVLRLRHTKVTTTVMQRGDDRMVLADFDQLRSPFPYVLFLPQWNFLDLVVGEARRYPTFRLVMCAETEELVERDGVVRGLRYRTAQGVHEVLAPLTVAADGRRSRLREAAGLHPVEITAPMDVIWFRLSRQPGEPEDLAVRVGEGQLAILINRFEYWQVGYLIVKDSVERIRAAGIEAFRRSFATLVPELADRVGELEDWDRLKLLTVSANRLRRWYRPGFLAIGDAAHAMSPVAGVGINIAIQDAVVAANVLVGPLRRGRVGTRHLWQVQVRRTLPVRLMQGFQAMIQRRHNEPVLAGGKVRVPPPVALSRRIPALRGLPARMMGVGLWRVRVRRGLLSARPVEVVPDAPAVHGLSKDR